MKPGEYIGSDGRAHNVRSIMLGELDDACNSATVQMDGGAWLTYKKHLVPHHPDFPLAVAALQSLLPKPTVHPAVGLRYCGEEEVLAGYPPIVQLGDHWRMRFYSADGKRWDLERLYGATYRPMDSIGPCGTSLLKSAFNAGRRYEKEHLDE